MKYPNLGKMFLSKRTELPESTAYRYKKQSQWISVSFKEAVDEYEKISAGLLELGIGKGDKVAIISNNRIEWALIDYAVVSIGAILVPIYPSLMPEQILFLVNHSEAKFVFAENEIQLEKVESVRNKISNCAHFAYIECDEAKSNWLSLNDVKLKGDTALKTNSQLIIEATEQVKLSDLATIIYTSGTTGEPKGSLLSHKNFLSNIENAALIFDIYPDDILLSFLPLSHVLERMAGHYQATFHSCEIAYAESIEAVPQNILEVQPTIMISVPRLYEKMYVKILDMVDAGSAAKQKIFSWAIRTGNDFIQMKMAKTNPGFGLRFKQKLADKLVFSKLKEKMGGKIRFFVSGGAPLSEEIASFFGAAGLYILEGYGLTETSPAITMNHLAKFRFGTVGPVLPNEEVKIADDGEVLTRGDHVMQGYFKNPEETAEVLDKDGWFYTGDIGNFDEDGFLIITDRKKNIIVTSGGKNIAPQPIENALVLSKYIEQSVMIGDRRKYCTAILTLTEETVERWSQEKGLDLIKAEDFNGHDQLRQLIQDEIERLTEQFASYESIKNFYIAPEIFSIESGELTPSLKVKRNVVEKKYAHEIDALYS